MTSILFAEGNRSEADVEGLDTLTTSIPTIQTSELSFTRIEIDSSRIPTATTNIVGEATGGAIHYGGTYSCGTFGAVILYFIFLLEI